MVVVDGIKYACERCIRGHRVSGCNHVDKPLTMIKKKGRPATHCTQCRKGKLGKPPRGTPALCACVDPRRERTVITPKDLKNLRLEHGVKVEFTDGTLMTASNVEPAGDQSSPISSLATPAMTTESSLTHPSSSSPSSSSSISKFSTAPGSALSPSLVSPSAKQEEGFNPYDALDSSSSYSGSYSENLSNPVSLQSKDSKPSVRYGRQDEYLNVPAFQYEAGFLRQPYNADLYNSPSGNNVAAAEANAGGESAAAVAQVNRGISGPYIGILTDDTKDQGSIGGPSNILPSAMTHHDLLSTSSKDLEASMSALGPLAAGPAPSDVEHEELVGGILRSSTQKSPLMGTKKLEVKDEPNTEENSEVYSSIQPMPELSSLY